MLHLGITKTKQTSKLRIIKNYVYITPTVRVMITDAIEYKNSLNNTTMNLILSAVSLSLCKQAYKQTTYTCCMHLNPLTSNDIF